MRVCPLGGLSKGPGLQKNETKNPCTSEHVACGTDILFRIKCDDWKWKWKTISSCLCVNSRFLWRKLTRTLDIAWIEIGRNEKGFLVFFWASAGQVS